MSSYGQNRKNNSCTKPESLDGKKGSIKVSFKRGHSRYNGTRQYYTDVGTRHVVYYSDLHRLRTGSG